MDPLNITIDVHVKGHAGALRSVLHEDHGPQDTLRVDDGPVELAFALTPEQIGVLKKGEQVEIRLGFERQAVEKPVERPTPGRRIEVWPTGTNAHLEAQAILFDSAGQRVCELPTEYRKASEELAPGLGRRYAVVLLDGPAPLWDDNMRNVLQAATDLDRLFDHTNAGPQEVAGDLPEWKLDGRKMTGRASEALLAMHDYLIHGDR